MRETGVWDCSERLGALFNLLSPRQQNRRHGSYLLGIIKAFQDYLTCEKPILDADLAEVGEQILFIHRLCGAFSVLLDGEDWQALLPDNPLQKELPELFSSSEMSFRATEFNIFTARLLQEHGNIPVRFLREEGTDERTPDLAVDGLAYFESKDLQSPNLENLEANILFHCNSANGQLEQQQARSPLAFAGLCVDLPRTIKRWEEEAERVIRSLSAAMETARAIDLVILSRSTVRIENGEIAFPHEWIVFKAREATSPAALEFAERIGGRVHSLAATHGPLARPL